MEGRGEIFAAAVKSVAAARAEGLLCDKDDGAVEALLALATKLDVTDAYMQELYDDAQERGLRPPSIDNVSMPTFLKFCESLGLTPAGRKTSGGGQDTSRSGNKSRLTVLRESEANRKPA